MAMIEVIHRDIMQAPTVMGLDFEKQFCLRVSKISAEEFNTHLKLSKEILDRLHESHTDSIYEMTSVDDFSFFVAWARGLASSPSCQQHSSGLLGIADMFSVLP